MKKITVKQDSHASAPYKILQVENTTDYSIGKRLTKAELDGIIRTWGCNHPAGRAAKGKVVIK